MAFMKKKIHLSLPVLLIWGLVGSVYGQTVDFTTLDGKVLFGYQGWFGCPGDWGGNWRHYAKGTPSPTNLKIDMWPDVRELPNSELCKATNFTIGGKPAYLFSSRNAAVVDMHFKWMRDYGLDGVLIQRFMVDLKYYRSDNGIWLTNILASAKKYGRTVAIEYDLSNASHSTWDADLQADWKYLVDEVKLTSHPNYLHHKGKPLVSVWGMGMASENRRPPEQPEDAIALIDWFHKNEVQKYQASVMGGVPATFRTLTRDARTDSGWLDVYRTFDAVQPWNVGRIRTLDDVNGWWKTRVEEDSKWLTDAGVLYMPSVFPGFSWNNLNEGSRNEIPRLGGRFIWQQAMVAARAGVGAVKIAMFDEVNEGTAMFKVAPTKEHSPDQGWWLTLDADGEELPSDWYLHLSREITKVIKGGRAPSTEIPIKPTDPMALAISRYGKSREGIAFTASPEGIRFHRVGTAGVRIFDSKGNPVAQLAADNGQAFWNGRGREGNRLPKGMYLAEIPGSDMRVTRLPYFW